MTQLEFEEALARSRARAEEIASALADAPASEVEALLREFVSCKYFLEPEELTTDNLIALGELSTAKLAGLKKSGVTFVEKSAGCTTASSGVIKKTLLAISVGKIIGEKLNPDEVANAQSISQLARVVAAAMQKRRGRDAGRQENS